MSILEKVNTSNDIKKLDKEELEVLCGEIRNELIRTVSRNGGHLASNLGTVELTVALHRVYDSDVDRIVFDVGHQCYTHKIITGRRDEFPTLRSLNGLSGFPKPYESPSDAFVAGHASNSVSVALGMARARTLQRRKYDVAAVIGDGALTGGLAYEGLVNAASSGEPMVIILNDNNMSINENVGSMAHMLQNMRAKPGYINFKRWYRNVFRNLPALYRVNHRIKEWLKSWLLPSNLFDEMGLEYLGPVDGHNLEQLETAIRWARDSGETVIVHVLTKKGKGYGPAEEHPEKFHGIGPFDPKTGACTSKKSFSAVFGEKLCALAEKDTRICAITAAMSGGTGLDVFAERFPERFFDTGIAEEHSAAMAAGMAKQGLIPVFAVYSSFLQRSYDMLIHDVALQKLHVIFAVDRAGIVGQDGETHQGVFDMAYLSSVPGMTVLCPASFRELSEMLEYAIYHVDGPVALRYPRGEEGAYSESHAEKETVLRKGTDLSILFHGDTTGNVLKAAELLEKRGISAELIKLGILAPGAYEKTADSVSRTGCLLAVEDVCSAGCAAANVLSCTPEITADIKKLRFLNLGDGIVPHGSVPELFRKYGLDAESIADAAERMLRG